MKKKKHSEKTLLENQGEVKETIEEVIKKTSFKNTIPTRLYGLIFICLGIIGFLNHNFLGTFICYVTTYAFGMFAYFFLGGLILLGIVLFINGKWPKLRLSFTGLGWIFLFLFGTLASSLTIPNLTISNFLSIHNDYMAVATANSTTVTSLEAIAAVRGGFFGDFFASLFITGLGMIGSYIFAYLFLGFGLLLIVRSPLFTFHLWLRDRNIKKRAEVAQRKIDEENERKQMIEAAKQKDGSAKHISPFEETKYEAEQTAKKEQARKTSGIFRDEKPEQEEDLFNQKDTNVSPMMSEYSTFEQPHLKRANEVDSTPVENSRFVKVEPEAATLKPKEDKKDENFNGITSTKSFNPFDICKAKREESDLNLRKSSAKDIEDNYNSNNEIQPKAKKSLFDYFKNEEKHNAKNSSQDDSDVAEEQENISSITSPTSVQRTMTVKDNYPLPSINLLLQHQDTAKDDINHEAARKKISIINRVFTKFNIGANVDSYTIGPSVTRFNIKREAGVPIGAISNANTVKELQIDLRGDKSVRFVDVVPGQDTSGIEIANKVTTTVSFRECMTQILQNNTDKLLVPLGENISSEVVSVSLDKLPHLLVSGTTGSGKSVFVHQLIMTLIMRNYPQELKFILIDPKQVEFSRYRNMPHLYCPIITNVIQAVATLKKLVAEMERRYSILSRYEVCKIQEYNELRNRDKSLENLPNLVCIIDEFADLMGQDPKNVDALTQRLTQKARAAGIYLIISTQRPSVKCITGTIKANIPARIALSLPTTTDSRTILDEGGAELLIGKGDLLARIPSFKSTLRLQASYVSNTEISAVVNYLKSQSKPVFNPNFINFKPAASSMFSAERGLPGFDDELYDVVKDYVMENNVAATSSLQRRFAIGYGRAAAILDALEKEGIIETMQPSNRKKVIKHKEV